VPDFPAFMKNDANRIATSSHTPGIDGYVFDGVDGSQVAFWTVAHQKTRRAVIRWPFNSPYWSPTDVASIEP